MLAILTMISTNAWGTSVTYTITSTSAVSTSGTAPAGSSATFAATYTDKNQMTLGETQTLTLSNYGIVAVTNITLNMKSNSSKGSGSLYYSTDNGTTKTYVIGTSSSGSKFNTSDWYGAWSTSYVDVSKDVSFVTESGKSIVIQIESYESSIYCASYTITYNTDKYTVTYDAQSGTCGTSSDTQANPGASLTLPSASPSSDCSTAGWVFAGWKKTSAQTSTIIPPTIYAAGSSYVPSANETLYAVYQLSEARAGCSAGKISSGTLAVGDIVILYYETGTVQYNGVDGSIGAKISYTTNPAESHVLLVLEGASSGQFAFYDMTDKVYLALTSGGNNLHTATSVTSNSSWTVSISDGAAAITSVAYPTRSIQYNTGSPRFACYEGTQQAVQLYKLCSNKITYNSNPNCTFDSFLDIMHDNVIAVQVGTYAMPEVSDASKGDDTYCDEKHYHFMGWVEDTYINDNGTLKDGYTLYPAGHAGHTAANKTFYAIWAKE